MLRAASMSLLLAAASPAAAQRLGYQDVLGAEHAGWPRLSYAPTEDVDDARASVRAFYGDRFEWRPQRGADAYHWDSSAELGSQGHRLWLAFTGDGLFGGPLEYLEAQALYSRPLGSSGLMFQAGVRRDFAPRPRRSYGVLGLQGTFGSAYAGLYGFLSHEGEATGRLTTYVDVPLAGRLIAQPAFETEVAGADVPELGIGAGPVYVQAGLRLRYRIDDRFSPYAGINWERLLGRTARLAREADEAVEATHFVLGVRSYFE